MKHIKTIFIAFAAMLSTTTYAQFDHTFIFVDKNDNEIPSGSVVTANTVESVDDGEGGTYEQIPSGVYVKNNSSEELAAGVTVTLNRLDNGSAQCCFPTSCIPDWGETIGATKKTEGGKIKAGSTLSLQTEWFPTENGEAEASVSLNVYDLKKTTIGNVSMIVVGNERSDIERQTLTIKFVKSATGINSIAGNAIATPVAYYSVDGKRLQAPQKGLNIIRLSNGEIIEIIK